MVKIVSETRRSGGHMVRLECGHSRWTSGYTTRRTRCQMCLSDAQKAWDAEHSCRHGYIGYCLQCRIAELEEMLAERDAKIAELEAKNGKG
jgi:hypothetical protein